MGVPPGRIDLLTELSGVTFVEAWPARVIGAFGEIEVGFIGREAFIRNKRATGRPKDLVDIDGLEQACEAPFTGFSRPFFAHRSLTSRGKIGAASSSK